jgi:hypothetical protein
VKSIFEGASKYDILNYLEDARERGLTDCDLGDLEEEEVEEDHGGKTAEGCVGEIQTILYIYCRNTYICMPLICSGALKICLIKT